MAFASATEARNAMVGFFATGATPTIPDVEAVFRFEPLGAELYTTPAIAVSSSGMTPQTYRVTVRVYVSFTMGAEIAQDRLDAIVEAADAAVDSRFGESDWRVRVFDDQALLRAECIYECGRND